MIEGSASVCYEDYADDTTTYAVIPRPLSRLQIIKALNQDLAEINY